MCIGVKKNTKYFYVYSFPLLCIKSKKVSSLARTENTRNSEVKAQVVHKADLLFSHICF